MRPAPDSRCTRSTFLMEQLFVFTSTELWLGGLTTLLFLFLMLYDLVPYARPLRRAKERPAEDNGFRPPVSVIVYAKNESENLRKHLPALLAQEYPVFEVIVINDGSTDESDQVLKTLENEYKQLYHTYIPENARYLSRKKLSLTIGIKAAKYDLLLFTEANCEPASPQWIASMVQPYRRTETQVVLGFCAYRHTRGFFHKLVAYDNLITGLQYLSCALKNHPYTGDGRNLSYRKSLFFEHKGYYKSLGLHAGDDDLFINEAATGANTAVVYSPDSLTEMAPVDYFRMWKEMKVSRAATKKYYKGGKLTFFRLGALCFYLFLAAVVASIVYGTAGNWLIAALAVLLWSVRSLVRIIVLRRSARLLGQPPLTGWLPLLETVQPLFGVYVRIYRMFRAKNDYTFRLGNNR